jgi:hypothetical protein
MGQVIAGKLGCILMTQCLRPLIEKIFVQATPQGYIDQLKTTADAKERLADPDGLFQKIDLKLIAGGIHLVYKWVWLSIIEAGMDITAPTEHNSVQAVR